MRARRHTGHVVEPGREPAGGERGEAASAPAFAGTLTRAVPEEIRDVSFHVGVRGYDRREVDRYVQRVNRVIAELEIASSPQSAVRHALDRVGEQTSGLLQHARETADEIVRTARSEAEETIARAKAEAGDIVSDARAEGDRIVAEAEADVTRAKSRASEIVAKASKDAEEILVRADTQVVDRRAREEQRLDDLRVKAEDDMAALRAETEAVEAERQRVLDQLRELAARLSDLSESGRMDVEPDAAPIPGAALEDAGDGEPPRAGDEEAGLSS
jgi:DivIVA domain-containing protein